MDSFGNKRLPTPIPIGSAFNSYAAGYKHYGAGRLAPNVGPVGDILGYKQRDNKRSARQNAIARLMKSQKQGSPMNQTYLSFMGGGLNSGSSRNF